jgi:hypothetical protein
LGVPGTPFALLLTRSADFAEYNQLLKLQLQNENDLRLVLTLWQQLWDPAESAGWLRTAGGAEAPELPVKQVLLQAGLGDAQVTPLAAEVMARGFQAGGMSMSVLSQQTRPIYGITERDGSSLPVGKASAIVEYNFSGVPPAPFADLPAGKGTDTHECVRRSPAAQAQIKLFLEEGQLKQFCAGGVCNHMNNGGTPGDDCAWV